MRTIPSEEANLPEEDKKKPIIVGVEDPARVGYGEIDVTDLVSSLESIAMVVLTLSK